MQATTQVCNNGVINNHLIVRCGHSVHPIDFMMTFFLPLAPLLYPWDAVTAGERRAKHRHHIRMVLNCEWWPFDRVDETLNCRNGRIMLINECLEENWSCDFFKSSRERQKESSECRAKQCSSLEFIECLSTLQSVHFFALSQSHSALHTFPFDEM